MELRDTLFGDQSLSDWASHSENGEPWLSFARARDAVNSGDQQGSIAVLKQVVVTPHLESRHYLQAWHWLREFGERPSPDTAKDILGVVVEVSLPKGLDLLAAYRDHHARYYNFSGAGVVWEHPNDSLDSRIDELLGEAANLAAGIGPWDKARPPAPPAGQARINILTPSGLHFGQGPINSLAEDKRGGKLFQLCTVFMQQVMKMHLSAST
jgi:hypothetical protein